MVRGLVINRFSGDGILVDTRGTEGRNIVEGNFLGTDVTGVLDLGNSFNGVVILGTNHTVGGATAEARNIVSSNDISGIQMGGFGNLVQGNFIGTDVTGTADLGNSQQGGRAGCPGVR